METLDDRAGRWKYVAVIDTAEVSLRLEEVGGDRIMELPWPDDWPSWVDENFLRAHGYEVVA